MIKEISSAAALLRFANVLNALSAFTFTLSIASLIRFIAISIQSNVSSKSFSEELLELEELDFEEELPLEFLLELLLELEPLEELLDLEEDFFVDGDKLGLYGLYPPVTKAVPLTSAAARPAT